jgi:hypothetical protein
MLAKRVPRGGGCSVNGMVQVQDARRWAGACSNGGHSRHVPRGWQMFCNWADRCGDGRSTGSLLPWAAWRCWVLVLVAVAGGGSSAGAPRALRALGRRIAECARCAGKQAPATSVRLGLTMLTERRRMRLDLS